MSRPAIEMARPGEVTAIESTAVRQQFEPHRVVPALDGVRALAVCLVMMAHTEDPNWAGGALGVDMFFVLSGYLITSVLLGEWQRRGNVSLRTFYAKRALRLYPALLLLLLLAAPVHASIVLPTWPDFARAAAVSATYLADFAGMWNSPPLGRLGHLWTLAVEEQFYLWWPAVLLLMLRRRLRPRTIVVLIGLVATASFVWLWHLAAPHPQFLFSARARPDTTACKLLLGCLVAVLVQARVLRLRPQLATVLAWTGLLGIAITVIVSRDSHTVVFYADHDRIVSPLCCLASALLVVGLAHAGPALITRMLATAPMRYVGRISYGLYLFHYPLFGVIEHERHSLPTALASGWRLEATMIAASIGVASLSYECVERRFLKLKDRLSAGEPRA